MPLDVVVSASAEARLVRVKEFAAARGRGAELVCVGATHEALADLVRRHAADEGAVFGWQRVSFARLAAALAAPAFAEKGVVAAGSLGVEALCSRLVHRAKESGALERLAPIADFPGLPKALARTLDELRLSRVDPAALAGDLRTLLLRYAELLEEAKLADRAMVFSAALDRVRAPAAHALLDRPTVLVDVAAPTSLEADLLAAVVARAKEAVVTVPAGDEVTLARLRERGAVVTTIAAEAGPAAVQEQLFSQRSDLRAPKEALAVLSAPGESRECVEIARIARSEALAGVPFDRMAVLLRAPSQYRAHLEEALRRASIPAHFARGTARPDPSGRALLALLSCKLEELSATRFSEYMSLGEIPRPSEDGAPPAAAPRAERWVPPDSEVVSDAVARVASGVIEEPAERQRGEQAEDADEAPVSLGTLRAPRLWEQLLVDAAVIKESGRWRRRLDGLENQLREDLQQAKRTDEASAVRIERDLGALAGLRDFALPLLDELEALPLRARWGEWIERLSALASRALRNPARVQAALAELHPMAEVGPIDLHEVRLVLEQRLTDVLEPPAGSRYGKLFVATPAEARGMDFEVVFIPGVAEKMFPQKVVEDPILPDAARAKAMAGGDVSLRRNEERSAEERLALRLAVGAARRRVVVTYPRLDVEQGRPRTPSFYALELLRAAEGALPGFDDLARRADAEASVRIGWPAPKRAEDAVDEAEYDLAILERVLQRPAQEMVGAARYLLGANPHLGRALRFRAERWHPKRWYRSDGLVMPHESAHAALRAHDVSARSFSPTALQNFAACPYRFLLQAVHRLAPREEPAPLEELDPLQRGSMMHEAQFETLVALREAGLLPVTMANLERARALLDRATGEVAARFEDELAPAIPRVWQDGVAQIRADLAEWLRRMATDDDERDWVPAHFELSFGLREPRSQQDDKSSEEPVPLDCGIKLRGSIDLVERRQSDGAWRATDHKSGKVRAQEGVTVIGGGKTLQPVLYALAIEKLLGGKVEGGRLYYCTSVGEYRRVEMRLDPDAREAAKLVADTVHDAIERGFLPAAPAKGECEWCDYQRVCGPYEEQRTAHKPKDGLLPLSRLRERA